MRNKKTKHRPTNEELEIFAELERMAKIASEKEKHFVMLVDDDLRTGGKDVRTYQTRLRDEKANERKRSAQQTKTVNKKINPPLTHTFKEQKMSYQDQMEQLINAELERLPKGTGRHIAVQNVCHKNPDLRAAAVREYNDDLQNRQRVVAQTTRQSRPYGQR